MDCVRVDPYSRILISWHDINPTYKYKLPHLWLWVLEQKERREDKWYFPLIVWLEGRVVLGLQNTNYFMIFFVTILTQQAMSG